MSTGRSMVSSCPARAALAGNPSDGYGGAVVAVPISDLRATASATEADVFSVQAGDSDLRRLLVAAADGFEGWHGSRPAVTLSASTGIPRSVGLAGSSALVIAALRALGAWSALHWQPLVLAELALSVERDRLGIEAGLQDRLVQSVGEMVSMTFDPVAYTVLRPPSPPPLYVAWLPDGETSDMVHRSIRRRFDAADEAVRTAMTRLAAQADRARRAIASADAQALADAMNRTFELRMEIVDVGDAQRELAAIGRRLGAAVNSAGSGGSVVGLARSASHLDELRVAHRGAGLEFLPAR